MTEQIDWAVNQLRSNHEGLPRTLNDPSFALDDVSSCILYQSGVVKLFCGLSSFSCVPSDALDLSSSPSLRTKLSSFLKSWL